MFQDQLHKEEGYLIHFSKRGDRARTAALDTALEQARENHRAKWNSIANKPIEVTASQPTAHSGLQAVDYFLWALQRFYERGESRYWEFLAEIVHIVHDVDDTRYHREGVYYENKNPLTAEKRKK